MSKKNFLFCSPNDEVMGFVNSVAASLNISRSESLNVIIRQYLVEHPSDPSTAVLDTIAHRKSFKEVFYE